MQLIIRPEQIAYSKGGLTISVEGFKGDRNHPIVSQVFIELYENKLRVHVWNGEEDPVSSVEIESL